MTHDEIIDEAANRLHDKTLHNPTQLRKEYRLSYVDSQYLWLEAKAKAATRGINAFPPPNHNNTLKEWMR